MIEEKKLEERQKSAALGYEKFLEYTNTLAHLLESHSETCYEGNMDASNIFLEDEEIESRFEEALPEMNHYRANTYIQLKNVEKHLEKTGCRYEVARVNNERVKNFFEDTEEELYNILSQASTFLPEAEEYLEKTPLRIDYGTETFSEGNSNAEQISSRLTEEF